ncbi:MAG: hypothetical protein KGL35_15030 [Bradyrhizobium sp.]|uniref:hypothetical protein n=1 Tax=Bradyrhizobium sp. TaxID=376 RepID=UPI00238A677A|nr:hypothetical protein [Bradyrhizobium sp.]MDE2069525.1 hypothetical protein [Bradyrhizobium sp.]MDE2470011.1 hypothetical protein [Bradyrhizobium sp.]
MNDQSGPDDLMERYVQSRNIVFPLLVGAPTNAGYASGYVSCVGILLQLLHESLEENGDDETSFGTPNQQILEQYRQDMAEMLAKNTSGHRNAIINILDKLTDAGQYIKKTWQAPPRRSSRSSVIHLGRLRGFEAVFHENYNAVAAQLLETGDVKGLARLRVLTEKHAFYRQYLRKAFDDKGIYALDIFQQQGGVWLGLILNKPKDEITVRSNMTEQGITNKDNVSPPVLVPALVDNMTETQSVRVQAGIPLDRNIRYGAVALGHLLEKIEKGEDPHMPDFAAPMAANLSRRINEKLSALTR